MGKAKKYDDGAHHFAPRPEVRRRRRTTSRRARKYDDGGAPLRAARTRAYGRVVRQRARPERSTTHYRSAVT